MCRGHHHRRGRRGYPNRDQWVERLQSYREHLEEELKNVQDLLERLGPVATGDASEPAPSA